MTEFDDDPENPDPSDMDQTDDETEPCPFCGKSIHEQAEFCHHCGKYLSREDGPIATPKWIIIAGVIVLIASLVLWLM
jgi:predicted nucleic acid-binding Zn ribbon protein